MAAVLAATGGADMAQDCRQLLHATAVLRTINSDPRIINYSAAMSKEKRPRETAEVQIWLPRSSAQPGAVHNYVNKHKQKDKALEVVFDPKGHK